MGQDGMGRDGTSAEVRRASEDPTAVLSALPRSPCPSALLELSHRGAQLRWDSRKGAFCVSGRGLEVTMTFRI